MARPTCGQGDRKGPRRPARVCNWGREGAHQQVSGAAGADARRVQPLEIHVLAQSFDALDAAAHRASGGEEPPQAAGRVHGTSVRGGLSQALPTTPAPPQGQCSPRGQLAGWHAPQIVGVSQLQRAVLLHAEHRGPLHAYQHALPAAPQQEHLDLGSASTGQRLQGESCDPPAPPHAGPSPSPALPLCWSWSEAAGAAVGRPPSGPRRSRRGTRGCLPARPGTGTGPGGEGRVSVGQAGWRAGPWGRRTCLVPQEEQDPAVGHKPQLLVEAFGVAQLALHADAGEAGAVQVGPVREPRVPGRLGAAGQRGQGQPRAGRAAVGGSGRTYRAQG